MEEQPFINNIVDDVSRYEFNLEVDNHKCRFIIINNIKTLIIIENLPIEKFSFFAIQASLLGPIFNPSAHLKIGRSTFKIGSSSKYFLNRLATKEVLSGFLTMTKNLNILTSNSKSSDETLEVINPKLQITLFSVPKNVTQVKNVLTSVSKLLDKIH